MDTASRPGTPTEEPRATLSLYDYRRRVSDLYSAVRSLQPPDAHRTWCRERDALFGNHPQSAIPPQRRATFSGLPVYPYDPQLRFVTRVEPTEPVVLGLAHSGTGSTGAVAFGAVDLDFGGSTQRLTLFWLQQYGGGVFLPFRDATSGEETYGGGRYLLDSAKGADLGSDEHGIVLDFNFAYHPSCVHDARWSCPLAPPLNTLTVPIRGGEHL